VPVSNAVALKAVLLPSSVHADPADRMIIATAQLLGARLVTKDQKIRRFLRVRTVW
jgi:PIN domain nuclease of toxin-antitoxin system